MANSVYPDETARYVSSGSALFAKVSAFNWSAWMKGLNLCYRLLDPVRSLLSLQCRSYMLLSVGIGNT